MQPKILYEDQDLMVIDKPEGMVVNRAETVKGQTVQDWVEENFSFTNIQINSEIDKTFKMRSGVAHRLDKETSGCLLIAKSPEVLEKLLALFKNREIHKEYLALVHGIMSPVEGTIRLPIGRDRYERKKRQVQVEGKQAETRWKAEKFVDGLTLVHLWPKTGRMHQIRVHMAHLGHPLVGDLLYLNKKMKQNDREKYTRHLLHAVALEFIHPRTNQKLRVESKPSGEFGRLIEDGK